MVSLSLHSAKCGMNSFKVLTGNTGGAGYLCSGRSETSTTDKTKRSRGDRQRKSKPRCLYSIYGENG